MSRVRERPGSRHPQSGAEPLTASTVAKASARPDELLHSRPGLVVIHPSSLGERPAVSAVTGVEVVGRGRDATIALEDRHVSRTHCEVRPAARGLLVRDLESKHGSSIEGRPLGASEELAEFGRVVRLGDTLLLVVRDVERYRAPPRRFAAAALGLSRDVVAGPVLSDVWDQATRAAGLGYPVLVLGESGSGKESVARLIHHALGAGSAFVGLNIAAVPEALFEAELFGFERGAFTGANASHAGAFREADGGVLFLDEVAELRFDLQAKLLRALDLQSVRALGSNRDVPVRVQLVAATSGDLKLACDEGKFRTDLYYRLSGVVIHVPPLRVRPDDVLLLANSILSESAPACVLSTDAAERLVLGAWPGNVRALRHAIVHAVARAGGASATIVAREHLPEIAPREPEEAELTEPRIRAAMNGAGGIAAKAAERLGVSRTTFYNTCKRLGIETSSLRSGDVLARGDSR